MVEAAGPRIAGFPVEFALFAAVLLGVAVFHRWTLPIALAGLGAIAAFKAAFGFALLPHLAHEAVTFANLFGLLCGFALLADHFDKSHVPNVLPRWLPDDWKGGFALLALVFGLSSFLDNIAAAMIGGTIAHTVFKDRVHVGFMAAIVAAANAGGSGSVLGDTTTTMMWIDGVSPFDVLHAYVAAVAALVVFGPIASLQQDRYQRIAKDELGDTHVDRGRLGVVIAMLVAAASTNVLVNVGFPAAADRAPWLALALWAVLLATARFRAPTWSLLPEAARGAVFLLALVASASMMPVAELPPASALSTAGLGVVSAVFDNIPLTALALRKGGYDWGFLAFAVGFGGSMTWFGSSAGVALVSEYPVAKSTAAYLRHGWHVPLGYVVGYALLWGLLGWHPHAPHRPEHAAVTEGHP